MMLTQIEVGQHGEQHLRQKLADSVDWKPIASAISHANILPLGQIYAVAEATTDCDLNDFETKCGNGGKYIATLVSKWIWEFVHVSPAHICLIDEPLSEPEDVGWRSDMLPSFADVVRFSNGSIFYYVSSKTISGSKEKVSELVQSALWYPSYYAFIVDNDGILDTQPAEAEVSGDVLLKAAMHTRGLVTDAYDLEGLLLWTKEQQHPELGNPFLERNDLTIATQ